MIHLFQIAYSEATLHMIEPGYSVLNNLENIRPDWYEYWPIRNFLMKNKLDEKGLYGFFSPKFYQKTGLHHQDVVDLINPHIDSADIFLFCPQPDISAFFLNVFEGGELFDSGKMATCEAFLQTLGLQVPLRSLVMDSRTTVFSNYFVARPAFWRRWLAINEQLFAICEDPSHPLHAALTQPTNYPNTQRKVFIMEGMASLLLTIEPHWRTKAANCFRSAWSGTTLSNYRQEAVLSDALKIAFREQGFPEYMEAFASLRSRLGLRPE